MEFKNMSKVELAKFLLGIVEKVNNLENSALKHNRTDIKELDRIRQKYKEIKDEIKNVANYVSKRKNQNFNNQWYCSYFVWSFKEANAFGCIASINSGALEIANSLNEASYRLTKSCSINELREIINEKKDT